MKTELLDVSEIIQNCKLHMENLILDMKTLEILFQLSLAGFYPGFMDLAPN